VPGREAMKRKLIDDIKKGPSRFYRAPSDVIRDRRFRDEERMEILTAWENEVSLEEMAGDDPSLLNQVIEAKKELQRKDAQQQ
jgi:hypothetical protein